MINDHQTLCHDHEGYQQTCKKTQAYFWAQQKLAQEVKKSVNSSNHDDSTAYFYSLEIKYISVITRSTSLQITRHRYIVIVVTQLHIGKTCET